MAHLIGLAVTLFILFIFWKILKFLFKLILLLILFSLIAHWIQSNSSEKEINSGRKNNYQTLKIESLNATMA